MRSHRKLARRAYHERLGAVSRIVFYTSRWHPLVISRNSSLLRIVELGFRCFSFLHYGIAQLLVSSFYELNRSGLLHSRILRR